MSNPPVDIHQVKKLASTGHFRSIALWLNYPLVPQAIYAQVQPHEKSGYLQVLIEFERPPRQDALIRLICHRICLLESSVIRGVHLVGRQVGMQQPLWQQRVRLAKRRRFSAPAVANGAVPSKSAPQPLHAPQSVHPPSPQPLANDGQQPDPVPQNPSDLVTAIPYGSETLDTVPSALIPRESSHSDRRRRRPHRSTAPAPVVHIRPADIDSTRTPSLRRRIQRRRMTLIPGEILEHQFKYLRAIVITGSAAAAFILGCVTESVMFNRGQVAQSPALPAVDEGWRALSDVEAQEVAYRSSIREPSVSAALEPVAVMPHEANDPQDPTVTLVFGGDVAVGDVPLQTPDAVGQVLGDLDMFREADVAMVGLGNSLAMADTSLQETYLDRSRADAVNSLEQGGIDIVSLTGDHTMDFGRHGLTETLESLDSAGIYRVGAGRNSQESRRPEILDVKGQRIAYLSYAPEGSFGADIDKAGVNIQDKAGIVEDIAALRQAVDWVVVNYRWHGELETEPSWKQINLSRTAIDAGADLVVGYHPKQVQGAELYKARPIVYALGDFVFQDAPLENRDTATLRVSLRDQQMKVEFLPISIRDARPKEASIETAKAILKQIRQASATFPSPLRFPAILEATPPQEPLLKPDKTSAPLKTLGELEPSQATETWSDPWTETWTEDQPTDAGTVDSNTWVPEQYEPNSYESGGYEPDSYGLDNYELDGYDLNSPEAPNIPSVDAEMATPEFEAEAELPASDLEDPWGDPYDNTVNINAPVGPLDGFQAQPDAFTNDYGAADDVVDDALPLPEKPANPLPKENLGTEGFSNQDSVVPDSIPSGDAVTEDGSFLDESMGGEEQPDEELVVPVEEPLPGYDSLQNWGEKESPHKEFNPIQDRLNSLKQDGLDTTSDEWAPMSAEQPPLLEEDPLEVDKSIKDTSGAISPHDEPLVGPLS
ncbi:CapA family protein [Leptothoe kymatousa]|uniref:CapA family protein n=1 Tax=Leptothoe kymatousa TAU-MAC 1615 TaxID=2364775 RepID=A0ABS5Y146_9CYAN|nr:CapA family protein [Leptothoe kymatousa]MBT9311159.1 CapA family protein [Leptothoe kymatousa TAU-MAC 1615]